MNSNTKSILVTGDTTIDHFIQLGERRFSDSPKDATGSCYSTIKGGAYLIHDFLKATGPGENISFGFDSSIFDKLPPQNQSFATIAKCKTGNSHKDDIWRIEQQFGFGSYTNPVNYATINAIKNLSSYDIAIIDDAGMDFGSHVNKEIVWPKIESLYKPDGDKGGVELVICKKSGDLRKGELWKELLLASKEGKINLITIVSVNDIRKQDARVSAKISWEQSALDIVFEIKNNINLCDLLKSKYLIMTFGSSGAVIVINNGDEDFEYKLIFDPNNLEDEWEEKQPGAVIGRMSCFTAAVANKLDLKKPEKNYKVEDAVISGLQTIRGFFDAGYLCLKNKIELPLNAIATASARHVNTFSLANIPVPENTTEFPERNWSILLDNYKTKGDPSGAPDQPLFDLARNVVMNGRQVLDNIPSIRLRKLYTVDRNEIESLRNIKKLIEKYNELKGASIPLSIAVFGLPGSGKSFGVKEIGKGVFGDDLPILDFNLSQFAGPQDLIGAFHQVRDEVLKGITPLVFWDEFDARNYEWLQYLLAPMQDGTFQEGQVTHTIGKCIMVFAGGTSYKMELFGAIDEIKEPTKFQDFKFKKGPDFISRIHGYLNITGPNPGITMNMTTGKWDIDKSDVCYPLRRSLFIRQILGLKDDKPLEIDWGLLNALLKVKKYKHGARSLTNLLKNIKENSDGRRLQRSHLPSNAILKLYVEDIDDFFDQMNINNNYYENALKIAPAIHQVWMGMSLTKNPAYETEFNLLPVFIKASNIDSAIRIPKVLSKAYLKIVAKSENRVMTTEEYQEYIADDNNKYLEIMAEEEHILWKAFYDRNDWNYDPVRNDYKKLHNCLVAYRDPRLSEGDRQKDRDQVLKYWDFLNEVGFGITIE